MTVFVNGLCFLHTHADTTIASHRSIAVPACTGWQQDWTLSWLFLTTPLKQLFTSCSVTSFRDRRRWACELRLPQDIRPAPALVPDAYRGGRAHPMLLRVVSGGDSRPVASLQPEPLARLVGRGDL